MWQAITDFLLKAHTAGLGHDAVIEIMVALLGVMIAVLTLISALVSFVFAMLGIWGYQTIREDANRMAAATARKTATKIAKEETKRIFRIAQAGGLSESQSQDSGEDTAEATTDERAPVKAISDSGLSESGEKS